MTLDGVLAANHPDTGWLLVRTPTTAWGWLAAILR